MTKMQKRTLATAAGAALVALAVLVSGCTGPVSGKENQAPTAKLDSSKNTGWTDDTFTFDGRDSSDPDGNISSWRFDFGDGTPPVELKEEDQAQVSHAFADGGEYTVTLTVFDSGKEQGGALSDMTTKTVAVNEETPIPAKPIYAVPTGNESTSRYSFPFRTHDGVDRFDLDLDLRSLAAAGSSEVRVRVLDPDGDVIEEQTVSIPANGERTVSLDDVIKETGDYKVETEAMSGGANVAGELKAYYDAGFTN